jgi:RNA polymerase sigma factor (sigma-70 family)
MATSQLNKVIAHLRSVALRPDVAGLPDGDLLKRYVRRRDEVAFEALVRRHGPMVMGVCRRVLHHSHDAEDAFQATFLVLVRRASTLRSPSMVGNWLYGVAYRTALEAKKAAAKRRAKEAMVEPRAEAPRDAWADLRPVLDQELDQLPDKYRAVMVLCDLEGKTRKEAARELGWPEGTVASRLATARSMLAKRLTGYGLSVSGGGLATMLCQNASAGVPSSVMVSTIKVGSLLAARGAAAGAISVKITALADGVLKTMLLTKLKIATVFILVVACVGVGGGLAFQTQAAADGRFTVEKAKPNEGVSDGNRVVRVVQGGQQVADAGKGDKQPEKSDAEKLRGTWVAISGEVGGKQVPEAAVKGFKMVFGDGKFTLETDGKSTEGTFKLNPAAKPKAIDTTVDGKTALAIYSLDGDKLKLCSDEDGTNRPTEFATKASVRHVLLIFKREKPAAPDKGTVKGLKLTLSADKTETVMKADGSNAVPVNLKLTFTNVSDKPIKIDAYALQFRLGFRCNGPSPDSVQKSVGEIDLVAPAPTAKDSPVLQPGKSWSAAWAPSFPGDMWQGFGQIAIYTLREPGTYKLRVTLYENMLHADQAEADRTPWLESNELELKVRAKQDEEQGKKEADAGNGSFQVRGVLDEIDTKNQTMTITVPLKVLKGKSIRRGDDDDIVIVGRTKPTRLEYIPYAQDAVFVSGTKQLKGSDLKAGMHVSVQLNRSEASQIVVQRVEVVQERDDGFQDIEIESETKGKT